MWPFQRLSLHLTLGGTAPVLLPTKPDLLSREEGATHLNIVYVLPSVSMVFNNKARVYVGPPDKPITRLVFGMHTTEEYYVAEACMGVGRWLLG